MGGFGFLEHSLTADEWPAPMLLGGQIRSINLRLTFLCCRSLTSEHLGISQVSKNGTVLCFCLSAGRSSH